MSEYDLSPLLSRLNDMGDAQYAAFNAGIVPGLQYDMLGVRTPMLHAIAKEIIRSGDWRGFLGASREHNVYEVRMLHGMVLGGAKCPIEEKIRLTDAFLPFIDNWAVCDTFVTCFKPRKGEHDILFAFLKACAASEIEFRKRFGYIMMMRHFGKAPYLHEVMAIYRGFKHEGYYARMGAAWGLATLWLADREGCLAILTENLWDDFTHNKAIQKLRESYRVSDEDKALVLTLKRKKADT